MTCPRWLSLFLAWTLLLQSLTTPLPTVARPSATNTNSDFKNAKKIISEIRSDVFNVSQNFPDQVIPVGGEYDDVIFIIGAAHCYEGMIGFKQGDGYSCVMMHVQSIRYLEKIVNAYNKDAIYLLMRSAIEIASRYSSDVRNKPNIMRYIDNFNTYLSYLNIQDKKGENVLMMCDERDRILRLLALDSLA